MVLREVGRSNVILLTNPYRVPTKAVLGAINRTVTTLRSSGAFILLGEADDKQIKSIIDGISAMEKNKKGVWIQGVPKR